MPNWNGDWIEVKSYDVEQSGSAGVGDSGGLEVRLEYDTGTPITRHIAMLFSTSGVTGTVSSATLTVNVDATDLPTGDPGTAFIMRVYAIDVGDTTALPTTIEDYLALSKTAAFGSKTFYGEDATTSVDVDVTAVVQEIFDRMDWFSGAGIGLLFEIQSGSGQPYYMTLSSIDPSSLDINTATVIDLAAGSFVLTGNAATFVSQYQIALATGTFNLSGIAMLPQIVTPLATGAFVLTGVSAAFQTVYSVDLAAGAFTLTGVAMLPQVSVPMGTGTFVFTGAAAGIETSYLLALDAGSFALTGNALALSYVVTAGTGSFTLTGNSITTPVTVPMGAGSFVLTGSEAQIAATSVIDLSAGSFTLSGAAMVPQVSTPLATGAFTLSGQAMVPVSHIILEMAAGSFTMTGQAMLPSVSIPMGTGSFALTGVATGADSISVTLGTGEFLMTGLPVDIESIGAIDCLTGTFVLTGGEVTFLSHTIIELESGSFELDGNSMVVTDPLAVAGGSVFTKLRAILDCGCGCAAKPCCNRTDLPDELTLTVTLAGTWCECTDWEGITVTLLKSNFTQNPGQVRWGGFVCGPCTVINGVDFSQIRAFVLECTLGEIGNVNGSPSDLRLWFYDRSNCTDSGPGCMDGDGDYTTVPGRSASATVETSTCDPLLLTFDFPSNSNLITWCQDPMTSAGLPTWQFVVTE